MGKNFSTIKGERKNAYLAEVMQSEGSDAEKLERLCTEISSAWVRNGCIPRGALNRKVPASRHTASTPEPKPETAKTNTKATAAPEKAPSKRFDPFSVHTINVYKKEGADGLRSALERIGNTDHLKSMVTAQRIPVSGLDKINDAETLRATIVTAVAERISDRKAAAS